MQGMQGDKQRVIRPLAVAILALGLLSATVFANKQTKTYPEVGKIVATAITEQDVRDEHYTAHTYTLVTESKSYLLECGFPWVGTRGRECGGSKKLQIGDVIHFRIEKDRVYIPITKSDNSVGEEKLRILSTSLRADAPPDKPQAAPEKSEPKPPASN
jgi:hypothetical protein